MLFNHIDTEFKKTGLNLGIQKTAQAFFELKEHQQLVKTHKIPIDCQYILNNKKFIKSELIDLYIAFFTSQEIIKAFRKWADPNVIKVMDYILWRSETSTKDIKENLGIDVTEIHGYRDLPRVQFMYRIFKTVDKAKWSNTPHFSLSIPSKMREHFIKSCRFKPKYYFLHPVENPEKTKYIFENGAEAIIKELPAIINYKLQGEIKLSKSKLPTESTTRKMQKKLKLKEFFPPKIDKEIVALRTHLLAGLSLNTAILLKHSSLINLGSLIYTYQRKFHTLDYILPYLSERNSWYGSTKPEIEKQLWEILKTLPHNKWISVTNLQGYIISHFIDINPSDTTLQHKWENISGVEYQKAVIEPTLNGTMFLFAALGMLDIAYDDIDLSERGHTYWSAYDGLKYVRLTDLGAYLTNQIKTYDSPEVKVKPYRLSSDTLLIITDEEDELAEQVLSKYTDKLNKTHYKTSISTFLKGCKNKASVIYKIQTFKDIIPKKIPKNWTQFFKELKERCQPLQEVTNVRVFKMPKNPALIRLIATDKKLSLLIIKAEDFQILVAEDNLSKFKYRLLKLGYVV